MVSRMLSRLWWKEVRQFWPIWVFLTLAAVVTQVLVLYYFGKDARTGILVVFAMGWTCLYAFAVAAAAFSGEREARTLSLLDTLPVTRWKVWVAKWSFALLTTIGLGLGLLSIAWLGTQRWEIGPTSFGWAVFAGLVILVEVVGWGLFWSALLKSALAAAVLAICTTMLAIPVLDVIRNLDRELSMARPVQLAVAVAATLASALFFIRSGPPRRPVLGRAFRVRRVRRAESPDEAEALVPRSAWLHAAHSLAWQTLREIRRVWWRIVLVGLVLPSLLWQLLPALDTYLFMGFLALGAGIMAGVSVFGSENRQQTQRFLAHHGVSPGLTWVVKMMVWSTILALPAIPVIFF